jgi:hypothetical protein
VSVAAPSRVLRLAILGWGLGDLALGRRYAGTTWLLAEAIGLAAVAFATLLLADTTWYLVPFLAGMAFIAAWAIQAVAAYRRAQLQQADADGSTPSRSPATAAAWLTIPLLVWGTGFWLFAADAGSPTAVLDRFVSGWTEIAAGKTSPGLADDPAALSAAVAGATEQLQTRCDAGELPDDCAEAPENLLRDIRLRLVRQGEGSAVAVAELVRFERRPTRFLGLFDASQLVAVPVEEILHLELAARPAALGSERWAIVSGAAP